MKIHDLSYCQDVEANIIGGCPSYQNPEIIPDVEVSVDPYITVDPDGEPAINEGIHIDFPIEIINFDASLIGELHPDLDLSLFVGSRNNFLLHCISCSVFEHAI